MDAAKGSSPSLALGAMQNNLIVSTAVYPTNSGSSGTTSPINHTCTVDNIPLQRWVNIIVSLNGRTMDVYINGKLTRTCVLPGVAKVNPSASIAITPTVVSLVGHLKALTAPSLSTLKRPGTSILKALVAIC